jgi:hypothetical protein
LTDISEVHTVAIIRAMNKPHAKYSRLVSLGPPFLYNLLSFARGLFIALMMEAVRASETSVQSNEITRRYIPEHSKLHTRCRENLKSHFLKVVHVVKVYQNTTFHGPTLTGDGFASTWKTERPPFWHG